METETSSCSLNAPHEASHFDEVFMHHTMLFADNLKDLKNLRKQLYSAAEYFELSYLKDDQKQLVVETLKDYVTKAVVGTVDHLGSMAHKVNSFLDEKVDEITGTELRFLCLQQSQRTCQEFVDRGGLSHQSLMIKTPKHYKCYAIPGAVQPATVEPISSFIRKDYSKLAFKESPSNPGTFSFTSIASNQRLDKRAVSPLHFPLRRSGSVVSRSNPLSSSSAKQRWPSEPRARRTVSLSTQAGERTREMEQYSKRSKRLFKSFLSLSKSRKDSRQYDT